MGFFHLPDGSEDEAKIDQLKTLVAGGDHSFSDIARVMGAPSRNVVLCKFNRLKDKDGTLAHPRPKLGGRKPRVSTAIMPRPKEPEPVQEPIEMDGLYITLMSLTSGMCNFPIGDPADSGFHYCGHKKRVGSSYCEPHHAKCYVPFRSHKPKIDHQSKRRA